MWVFFSQCGIPPTQFYKNPKVISSQTSTLDIENEDEVRVEEEIEVNGDDEEDDELPLAVLLVSG